MIWKDLTPDFSEVKAKIQTKFKRLMANHRKKPEKP